MSKEKELIVPIKYSVVDLFEGDKMPVVIKLVQEKVAEFQPNMETQKGRDELKSFAYLITRSKTYLDDMGKQHQSDAKKIVDGTNSVRKSMREQLDELQAETRKPLTEYEAGERARIANIEHCINLIAMMASAPIEHGSIEIRCQLDKLKEIIVDDSFGDLETPAFIEKEKSIEKLTAQLETVKQREIDKAELEELRKGKAEQEEKERKEKEKQYQADREKQILKEAAEKADQEKKEAAERAEREKEQAIENERQRVADEKERERKAEEKREANKKHCAKINNAAAAEVFHCCGLDEDQAKTVITAIAQGKIPNVKITY